jgi:hypothetical protein
MPVIINGTTGIDTVQDGIVTDAKLNLTANSQEIKDALNATGSADIYACRAWVNFDGTGTPAIRASGNVSSITDNNTGDYTVNFTTAMPDANYSTVIAAGRTDSLGGVFTTNIATNNVTGGDVAPTTTAIRVVSNGGPGRGPMESTYFTVAVFR